MRLQNKSDLYHGKLLQTGRTAYEYPKWDGIAHVPVQMVLMINDWTGILFQAGNLLHNFKQMEKRKKNE